MSETTKACQKCKLLKPFSEFGFDKSRLDFLQAWCKSCHKEYRSEKSKEDNRVARLRNAHGLESWEYDSLLIKQKGVCAICKKVDVVSNRNLCVDHCKNSNYIRGLLCTACNTALGNFGHDIEKLKKAISYLSAFCTQFGLAENTIVTK